MERLFLLPRLALSLQIFGQSWYCNALARFLMPSDSAFVKKNNLRMSRAGFPSSIVTVEHSCVLDIIVEKFLPPPHSSHCTCFEDSSVWAWNPLLSRSTRAFVLIAYIRAKHARAFMRALIRSIVCPYLCSLDSRQLRQAFTLLRVILHILRYLWFLGTTFEHSTL